MLPDPQGFDPVALGDFHLLYKGPRISMGSLVAVEPSGTVLPSTLGSLGSIRTEPYLEPLSREL
ncbi:MAG: hypothetical protein RQ885_08145 [Desulfurococcales archaeon]|nr:hypothetical protein [Desulfurococcales archaeon]